VPPSLILTLLLASICGLLFHSLFGRKLWQLPCFWLSAMVGFSAGEILAILAGVEFLRLGNVPLLPALVGTLVALLICWFFTSTPQPATPGRARGQRGGTLRRG